MVRKLSHVGKGGRARMVDVGGKRPSSRRAVARGVVKLTGAVFRLVRDSALAKGDVLTVAQIAGIQAGKRASEWIPLCHPIPLDAVEVRLKLDARRSAVVIEAEAATRAATGVEMEALVAVAAAALTVYDMCKSADKGVTIERIALHSKSGGKSGTWRRDSTTPRPTRSRNRG